MNQNIYLFIFNSKSITKDDKKERKVGCRLLFLRVINSGFFSSHKLITTQFRNSYLEQTWDI